MPILDTRSAQPGTEQSRTNRVRVRARSGHDARFAQSEVFEAGASGVMLAQGAGSSNPVNQASPGNRGSAPGSRPTPATTHYQRLSVIEADYESTVQSIFAGPGPRQNRNNVAFEIADRIVAAPWLSVTPLAEYFVDPDNLFDPAQRRRPSAGFEAGAFAAIPLGKLLGTSNTNF